MKTFLTACVAAGAMAFASADTAQAQIGYYGGYSPYYGNSYYGNSYYGGAGVRNFSYGTTLPGGGYYSQSYVRPNYNSGGFGSAATGYVNPNGGFSSSSVGYSFPAPYVVYPGGYNGYGYGGYSYGY